MRVAITFLYFIAFGAGAFGQGAGQIPSDEEIQKMAVIPIFAPCNLAENPDISFEGYNELFDKLGKNGLKLATVVALNPEQNKVTNYKNGACSFIFVKQPMH